MKIKIYITGNTTWSTKEEANVRFARIVDQIKTWGDCSIMDVSQISSTLNFKDQMDARMKEIARADVVIFLPDWKGSIESRIEFQEAFRLKKIVRLFNSSDMGDLKRMLLKGKASLCER